MRRESEKSDPIANLRRVGLMTSSSWCRFTQVALIHVTVFQSEHHGALGWEGITISCDGTGPSL
jgi:hypothetical protein